MAEFDPVPGPDTMMRRGSLSSSANQAAPPKERHPTATSQIRVRRERTRGSRSPGRAPALGGEVEEEALPARPEVGLARGAAPEAASLRHRDEAVERLSPAIVEANLLPDLATG